MKFGFLVGFATLCNGTAVRVEGRGEYEPGRTAGLPEDCYEEYIDVEVISVTNAMSDEDIPLATMSEYDIVVVEDALVEALFKQYDDNAYSAYAEHDYLLEEEV